MINKIKELDINIEDKNNYNFENKSVPRVTKILSNFGDTEGLCIWANSLGFRRIRYKQELLRTANIGSETHKMIEDHINDKIITHIEYGEAGVAYKGFKLWWNDIATNNVIDIIYTEHTIICEYFGGTLDALIKINGKIYLIDWKTSNHITSKYFIQLAAYRYMLKHMENINIDGCIILQLDKKVVGYEEYFLPLDNDINITFINECENVFMSFLYSYLLYNKIDNDFNNIFKEGKK